MRNVVTIPAPRRAKKTKEVPDWYIERLEQGADSRNMFFILEKPYLQKLFKEQNYRCALTGKPLWFSPTVRGSKYQNASLDRVCNEDPYLEGNVQWILKEINFMKGSYSNDFFIKTALNISKYHISKRERKSDDELALVEKLDVASLATSLVMAYKEGASKLMIYASELAEQEAIDKAENDIDKFIKFIASSYSSLKNIKLKGATILIHFPTYYKKWKENNPTATKKILFLDTLNAEPWFTRCSAVVRLNGIPTRAVALTVMPGAPAVLVNLFAELVTEVVSNPLSRT